MPVSPSYLFCAKVTSKPPPSEGAVKGFCTRCLEAVWVSVEGQRVLRETDCVVTCLECASEFIHSQNNPVRMLSLDVTSVDSVVEEFRFYEHQQKFGGGDQGGRAN